MAPGPRRQPHRPGWGSGVGPGGHTRDGSVPRTGGAPPTMMPMKRVPPQKPRTSRWNAMVPVSPQATLPTVLCLRNALNDSAVCHLHWRVSSEAGKVEKTEKGGWLDGCN